VPLMACLAAGWLWSAGGASRPGLVTERLSLEPLSVAHAVEMGPLLDDACLHVFTGGVPLSTAALGLRYAKLATRPAVTNYGATG
jgi:hypothetical protein